MNPAHIYIKDYNYSLPSQRIAEFPLEKRDQSKLLVYKSGNISDDHFYHLSSHLPAGTTLVLNNTRVLEARLLFKKETGGVIEIFCLEPHGTSIEEAMQQTGSVQWNCLIGGASKWKHGLVLQKEISIAGEAVQVQAKYLEKREDDFVIEFLWSPGHYAFHEVVHEAGHIPLPPYIKRNAQPTDAERYQTVFARHTGSVAAPTAALHFTTEVLVDLEQKNIDIQYLTLHVGAGTFKPVKTETVDQHPMHSEHFTVTASFLQHLIDSKTIIAVGTTSLRTLESLHWLGVKVMLDPTLSIENASLSQWEAYELSKHGINYRHSLQALLTKMMEQQLQQLYCETSILIIPGYTFQLPAALITNFHQPQSTLLLLIAAFIGDDWKRVYDHALQHDYRFLSYGDSSLLWRRETSEK